MRIGIVCGCIYGGGSERMVATLASGLVECGNEVYLIQQEKREKEYQLSAIVKRIHILQKTCGFADLLKDSISIHRFANKNRLDVVLGFGIFWNLCVCLAKRGMQAKAMIAERNSPAHDSLSRKSKVLRKLLYPMADGFIFQTQEEAQYYSKRIQRHGTIIHNALMDDLPIRSAVHTRELVALGRVLPQKNYTLMIQMLKLVIQKYPEYRLRIFGDFGDGQEKLKLVRLIADLELTDYVIFEGFCLDVHEKIKNSDIFVMSSDYEGLPNALMEAMAMGFPVVCTDCAGGGPRELIDDGKNGLLVPVKDAENMARKIIWLIEHPAEKEEMGRHAIEIRESHSAKRIVKEWEKALER